MNAVLNQTVTNEFALYNGDSCEILPMLPDNSADYSIFSPPFASLYTFSNSPRDLGNCRDYNDFFVHFDFIIKELARVLKPGRNLSFHCMLLPSSKQHNGFIGLQDFRGDLIRAFQNHGFIFHSEVVIWKDPVIAMQRTKALGLLHKSVRENASMSRQGVADYLVTMRNAGDNEINVTHTPDDYPVDKWKQVASPVWMDINPSDTLQYASARENKDERHISPLQLGVIERGIDLWTNKGETVLSPFAGIGSEGYMANKMGRKFVGIELKESYYKQAAINIANVKKETNELFDFMDDAA
jgi:DNA modification methylase